MLKKETNVTELQSTETYSRKSMIKSNAVRQSALRKVVIKENTVQEYEFPHYNSTVEPIMDNGLVVGVSHRCCCGESTEIRFELEQKIPSESLES